MLSDRTLQHATQNRFFFKADSDERNAPQSTIMLNDPLNDDVSLLNRLRDQGGIFDRLREISGSELQQQRQLRAEFSEDIVRAALALQELRERAKTKFSRADHMWFDRQGLEQSTSEAVAQHKAKRFRGTVTDLCSGIGGDAIALAARGEVIAWDQNPAACLKTQWNAEVYQVQENVHTQCQDVEQLLESHHERPALVHLDPDRRTSKRGRSARSLRIEEGSPGLPFLERLMDAIPGGAIKLSPAANFLGKFPTAEIELISLNGECKEATIWFGNLAQAGVFRATVLPANETLFGNPLDAYCPTGPAGKFLYDPDPAVVRSGMVNLLAETCDLTRLDDAEEYLTSNELCDSPFVQAFEILEELPNNERAIRRGIRSLEAGEVEIKCRHVPINADAVRRKLPLTGHAKVVLVYARLQGKTRALLCRRI